MKWRSDIFPIYKYLEIALLVRNFFNISTSDIFSILINLAVATSNFPQLQQKLTGLFLDNY